MDIKEEFPSLTLDSMIREVIADMPLSPPLSACTFQFITFLKVILLHRLTAPFPLVISKRSEHVLFYRLISLFLNQKYWNPALSYAHWRSASVFLVYPTTLFSVFNNFLLSSFKCYIGDCWLIFFFMTNDLWILCSILFSTSMSER